MIEINPRISTIVYQEDLNLPWLGVKRALGEISDEELASLCARGSGRAGPRFDTSIRWNGTSDGRLGFAAVPLEAACEEPTDEERIKRAVDAAELVASTAGEPPDELPADAREWVETHGVPPEDLVELACDR